MMNNERYVRKGYKIWDTYSDKEVQELNYRYQSDCMCEILNEKEDIIQKLELENKKLRKQLQMQKISYEAKEECGVELERGVPL